MSERLPSPNQRLKILYLYKILLDYTDEDHHLTMPEIIAHLQRFGISAGRKALYEDIEALKVFGLDIVSGRGSNSGYAVVGRDFELPELKLLADAAASSKFLTEKKSAQLIRKLETLTSVYSGKQLARQVFIADRVKTGNERIYIVVDTIHRAIHDHRQISFRYFDYDVNKQKKYREGKRVCPPYALTWDNDKYYLVAYYAKYGTAINFRVDRMDQVKILPDTSDPMPEGFSLSKHLASSFSMFTGTSETVKLRFDNSLMNVVIDHFGRDVPVFHSDDGTFTISADIKTEKPHPFFGWLVKFGSMVQIIEPVSLREKYIEHLKSIIDGSL